MGKKKKKYNRINEFNLNENLEYINYKHNDKYSKIWNKSENNEELAFGLMHNRYYNSLLKKEKNEKIFNKLSFEDFKKIKQNEINQKNKLVETRKMDISPLKKDLQYVNRKHFIKYFENSLNFKYPQLIAKPDSEKYELVGKIENRKQFKRENINKFSKMKNKNYSLMGEDLTDYRNYSQKDNIDTKIPTLNLIARPGKEDLNDIETKYYFEKLIGTPQKLSEKLPIILRGFHKPKGLEVVDDTFSVYKSYTVLANIGKNLITSYGNIQEKNTYKTSGKLNNLDKKLNNYNNIDRILINKLQKIWETKEKKNEINYLRQTMLDYESPHRLFNSSVEEIKLAELIDKKGIKASLKYYEELKKHFDKNANSLNAYGRYAYSNVDLLGTLDLTENEELYKNETEELSKSQSINSKIKTYKQKDGIGVGFYDFAEHKKFINKINIKRETLGKANTDNIWNFKKISTKLLPFKLYKEISIEKENKKKKIHLRTTLRIILPKI